MNRTLAIDVKNHIGEEIKLNGWVHQIRLVGKIKFVILRDRTGLVQTIVLDKNIDISNLERESAVAIFGKPKLEKQAPNGVELEVSKIEVIEKAQSPLPFEVNRASELTNVKIDSILDHRPFSLRNLELASIFRLQAEIVRAYADFMRSQGFLQIHTSKIISAGTEGGTNLFPIQYFEQKAYLAQSPQFYKQMMVGAGYERVFEIGFVYRAEDHATSRHINEYLSLDFEMGFIEDEQDVIKMEIKLLQYMFEQLKKNCAQELKMHNVELPEIKTIPQLRLSEAIKICTDKYNKKFENENDLDPEAERLICEYSKKEFASDFVFITHYPQSGRPFYTMPAEDGLTRGFDLLYKGLEVTTGSQRINNFEMLVSSMKKFGLKPEDFEFYLEIFRYGMPSHGGLAIGTERLTQQILNLKNIREACLFPRDRYRLTP
ncbi:MAG: aspartate--tRNA(Asn) ligase [Candidatus Latescibacteria bacterium]|nr:aspartate--tRNA(Asn) ligase [Candidatus Latescibacterota bacterium]